MAKKQVPCPVCGNSESSIKVSEIYIQSLVRLKNGDQAEAPLIDQLQKEIPEDRREKLKGSRYYRTLMESFAPPQGENQITRAVNPDWVAIGFLLISLYFLYQIYTTQYSAFWYILGLLIVAIVGYSFLRKKIFAKYQSQRDVESGVGGKVEKAIGYWMKLYYCAKDNVIFLEGNKTTIPIDQMRPYLFSLVEESQNKRNNTK